MHRLLIGAALSALSLAPAGVVSAEPKGPRGNEAEVRAEKTVAAMKPDEMTILTAGIMPLPITPNSPKPPADAVPAAGYIAGLPRLGVPALRETDASLGVAYALGIRKDGATALPSALAMASTFNDALVEKAGAMIGGEARAKGFNVMLAGGVNLIREPRSGRAFEYFSEDPLLSGRMAGAAIKGIQSNHIISTIKHLALNDQETGRRYVDVQISDAAARESDLLAFQIGLEIGRPGSVMCAYNQVNGRPACSSDYLLNKVLKTDWGFKGFVMSDWGSVPELAAALHGLDQQSAAELDAKAWFREPLAEAAQADRAYRERLRDMNKRILYAIYDNGLDVHPATPGGAIDAEANAHLARKVAEQSIVLLRNRGDILPLSSSVKRIAVIGGYAHEGVLSGGGSSQVHAADRHILTVPMPIEDPASAFIMQGYHPSSPLKAIRQRAPQAQVTFRQGDYIADAVAEAKRADVVILFADKWATEGMDVPDLTLPKGQDALIAAVTAANPNTVVVLETGNPVAMPWLDSTAAVLEAWYPGARGGEAIASVLFGDVNPSGRLAVTFPASLDQLPRHDIDGYFTTPPNIAGYAPSKDARLTADYTIEGSDVGYRWMARSKLAPLFPFGFGLSYTRFETRGLKLSPGHASFTVTNTGAKAGATVAQLYLVDRDGKQMRRLVGYQRAELEPGASTRVSIDIDPRLLADWESGGWSIAGGHYKFALGENAQDLGESRTIAIKPRHWRD